MLDMGDKCMKLEQVLKTIDRAGAWSWIRETYLPAGPACPGCGQIITGSRALDAFARMERTYCKECGSNSPARAFVQVLRGTEWQPEEYVKLLILQLTGQHPAYIGAILGKSSSCVRDMIHRLEILTETPTLCPVPLDG